MVGEPEPMIFPIAKRLRQNRANSEPLPMPPHLRVIVTWPRNVNEIVRRYVVRNVHRYGRGWTKVMTTPLVLPLLDVEICGANANILSL
jgi:hypothetical protein